MKRIGDLAILSVLWLVGCIPLFTIGASTAAVFSAARRSFNDEFGSSAVEYLKGFRQNFRQATLSFLPIGALALISALESFVTEFLREQGEAMGALRPFFLMLGGVAAIWTIYDAAYSAHFTDTVKRTLTQSGVLMLANPGQSLAILSAVVIGSIAVRRIYTLALIVPGLVAWLSYYLIEKIFARFTPEEPEDGAGKE